MIFNKKCFDYDLTNSERSNKLIQALQSLRSVSTSGQLDDYEPTSGVDHYASSDGCNGKKVISRKN